MNIYGRKTSQDPPLQLRQLQLFNTQQRLLHNIQQDVPQVLGIIILKLVHEERLELPTMCLLHSLNQDVLSEVVKDEENLVIWVFLDTWITMLEFSDNCFVLALI